MKMLELVTCHICLEDIDLDESVWGDSEGNVDKPIYAYCVACLPAQKGEK